MVIDIKDEVITIREELANRIVEEKLDTKEKAVRDALIALGWTPPKDKE